MKIAFDCFTKGLIVSLFCVLAIFSFVGCGNKKPDTVQDNNSSEEHVMKLFINDKEIPVIWEENDSVAEIMEEVSKGDIIISMSMYSDNEQVGSLGKNYTRNDKQTTTHNGDIVLYSGSNIVLFYGSNSWSYTRLGKMDLSEAEVIELLSNGAVSLKITCSDN